MKPFNLPRIVYPLLCTVFGRNILWNCYAFAPVTNTIAGKRCDIRSNVVEIVDTSGHFTNLKPAATTALNVIRLDGYDEAFAIIDKCAISGETTDELYDAVRFVDKNAIKIYPDESHKQELWETAYGSWKLQLATGGGKFTAFKKIPIFAFAMVDVNNFGNGVGLNENFIVLSLLGPHIFNTKRRQMTINIDDIYLFSSKTTPYIPSVIKDGMGVGKRPVDYEKKKQRPPAFTFIGASEHALIARGGSGGIAIWTRLQNDISPAAYGSS